MLVYHHIWSHSHHSQVSDVFQEKVVGITCYKHKFGIVGKGKHSRIRFSMFPTWEIGFGCHVTLILKVIDFIQKYIITLYVTVTYKVIFVFFINLMSSNRNNLM